MDLCDVAKGGVIVEGLASAAVKNERGLRATVPRLPINADLKKLLKIYSL